MGIMNAELKLPLDRIAALCQRYQIHRLALFGSALRDDFGPESDVDVLVEFDEYAAVGLFKVGQFKWR